MAATFIPNDSQPSNTTNLPLSNNLISTTQQQAANANSGNGAIATSNNVPFRLAFDNSCQAAQLLAIILELITFCIEHHAYHIRTYLLQKEILHRIMILTKSRHTFLVLSKFYFVEILIFNHFLPMYFLSSLLAVIRLIRKIIALRDEFYNRHIISLNLFQQIVETFLTNNGRYNLLDSAVIDLFEYIDHNDIDLLINYTVDRFWKCKLERIDYVRTFKSLKRHYDQLQHRASAYVF